MSKIREFIEKLENADRIVVAWTDNGTWEDGVCVYTKNNENVEASYIIERCDEVIRSEDDAINHYNLYERSKRNIFEDNFIDWVCFYGLSFFNLKIWIDGEEWTA